MNDCPLCREDGGRILWRDDRLRVIDAGAPGYPGFTRVIWRDHVREMTDLSPADRDHLMQAVWAVEQAQRETFAPDKINLASLGNMVPHLHWHVIPRWRDDPHFPDAVWAAAPAGKDEAASRARAARIEAALDAYRAALVRALDDRDA